MKNEIPTPRTDEALWVDDFGCETIEADFARQIERELIAATTWQPIETAPKDVDILVAWKVEVFFGKEDRSYWLQTVASYSTSDKMWELTEAGSYASDYFMSANPSHWMPLPEPPQMP